MPSGVLNPATWLSPATWTTGSPAEFTLNILLFIPLGVLAYQLFGGHIGILLPIALTVLIEIAQIALPDRASDPRDLLANILGSLLAWSVSRRRLRTKKT